MVQRFFRTAKRRAGRIATLLMIIALVLAYIPALPVYADNAGTEENPYQVYTMFCDAKNENAIQSIEGSSASFVINLQISQLWTNYKQAQLHSLFLVKKGAQGNEIYDHYVEESCYDQDVAGQYLRAKVSRLDVSGYTAGDYYVLAWVGINGGESVLQSMSEIAINKSGASESPHGKVTISDVTVLINLLLTGNTPPSTADCDQDSKVNISDVTALINYLLSGSWN